MGVPKMNKSTDGIGHSEPPRRHFTSNPRRPSMPSARVRTFAANACGRDFVVGDVHGCFRTLERALAELQFDADRDRLFGVGDLVNRGPHSVEAVDWLEQRFTAVTLGNHDRAALRWFEEKLGGSHADGRRLEGCAGPTRLPALGHRAVGDAPRAHRGDAVWPGRCHSRGSSGSGLGPYGCTAGDRFRDRY